MPDREKAIRGLECHQIDKDHRINCSDCPYHCDEFMNGLNELHNDALSLLKEQEAVVRCKDCYWRSEVDEECANSDSVCYRNGRVQDDFFCADGEGRSEDA